MKRRVSPALARRTVSTSRLSPAMNRASPIRSSGPLATSRMPVASTTMAPGRPRAKRSYHASTLGRDQSVLARAPGNHGGNPGALPQSRVRRRGRAANSRARSASPALGQRPGCASWRMRSGGLHMRHDRFSRRAESAVRQHGGGFDFDLRVRLHERGHLDHGHRRKVPAHDGPIGRADLPAAHRDSRGGW